MSPRYILRIGTAEEEIPLRLAGTRRKHRVLLPILLAALVGPEDVIFVGSAVVADDGVQRPIETGEIELREVLREALRVDAERISFWGDRV